jgi:hypothetical protein
MLFRPKCKKRKACVGLLYHRSGAGKDGAWLAYGWQAVNGFRPDRVTLTSRSRFHQVRVR